MPPQNLSMESCVHGPKAQAEPLSSSLSYSPLATKIVHWNLLFKVPRSEPLGAPTKAHIIPTTVTPKFVHGICCSTSHGQSQHMPPRSHSYSHCGEPKICRCNFVVPRPKVRASTCPQEASHNPHCGGAKMCQWICLFNVPS